VPSEFDTIIVGGGLQGGLLALAMAAYQPRRSVALVERAASLGGNHTWCFHAGDVSTTARPWIEPLVVHRWPGYRVHFPGLERAIPRPYAAITSARLHDVVERALSAHSGSRLFLGAKADHIGPRRVCLGNGMELQSRLVLDARGPVIGDGRSRHEGYQKFLGLEVELEQPHTLDEPLLMDATVAQPDGFRFVYTLPLTRQRLLVEDTYFTNTPDLDRALLRQRLQDYVTLWGWKIKRVEREEEGVLPMPWRGKPPLTQEGPLAAGYRGGFFHPGTGYSFPVALRLAELLATLPVEEAFGPALQALVHRQRRQAAFCHLLNYMLFCWFPPSERWHIFQRFYRLPLKTIERFYALRLGPIDMARLVLGKPPHGMSLRYGCTRGFRG
jgi:lycopene beta-cyclase